LIAIALVGRPLSAVVQIGRAPDQALPAVGKHLGFVHHHALEAHVGQQVGVGRVHHRHPLEFFQALLQGFEVAQVLGLLRGGRGRTGFGRQRIAVPEPAFPVLVPVGHGHVRRL
jgi:hypothetical protein